MNAEKQKELVAAICNAIRETVEEAGPLGAPSGLVYLALSAYGITLDQYTAMISAMVETGVLTNERDLLRVAPQEPMPKDARTNPDYWDCECPENYIHRKAEETECDRCGHESRFQPDSRASEVARNKKLE